MHILSNIVGGFNQPIMCGGEPRVMTRKNRGIADTPYYSIKIRVPKYGTLFFSQTFSFWFFLLLVNICGVKNVH